MSVVFQDFFTGSSLNAAWTRRNIVSGDETWNGPGLTVAGLVPGDFYLMTAPTGDFTVELEFTGKSTGSDMIGVAILDGSGGGIMASSYPNAVYNLTFSGYSYSGLFSSPGGGNYAAARLRLTKVGLNFTTAYSTNGGSSWSSESSALSPIASVAQIGVGCILGGGTIKLVELTVSQNVPDATITPPAATATAAGLGPTISTGISVAAPAAAATASAPSPSISVSSSAEVTPPAASATASAPSPTVTTVNGATVTATAATATADGIAATPSGGATVSPPAATATATGLPTATTTGGVVATAATATATAAPATFIQSRIVVAPAAQATATPPQAIKAGNQSTTVTAPAATATATTPAATVSAGDDVTIVAEPATATASTGSVSIGGSAVQLKRRWTLRDPDTNESWEFPINPNKMASPHSPRSLHIFVTPAFYDPAIEARGGMARVFESNKDPYEWNFSGYIRTEQHYRDLLYWSRKVNKIHLTDHLDRTWEVRMVEFDPDEKRPTFHRTWRMDYQIKAINYGAVA